MQYELRKYEDSDYEFVYEVKKLCYQKYVDEYYGGWVEKTQREMFAKLMVQDAAHSYIILVSGERVGFFSEGENSSDCYRPNNICLKPDFRGKGIGTDILTKAIEKHKSQDIVLRCFKSNPAQNLYKRLGFVVFDETQSHFLFVKKYKK